MKQTPENLLTPALLHAYRDARYQVWIDDQESIIKIDTPLPRAVLRVMSDTAEHSTSGSGIAVITACNPYSQIISEADNQQRQLRLQEMLRWHGYRLFPALNTSPAGDWQEPGFLVMNISLEMARSFARCFQQNAIVYAQATDVAHLVAGGEQRL